MIGTRRWITNRIETHTDHGTFSLRSRIPGLTPMAPQITRAQPRQSLDG